MAVADTAAKEGQSRLESELREPALKYCSSCLFPLLSCFNPDPHLRARQAVLHLVRKLTDVSQTHALPLLLVYEE